MATRPPLRPLGPTWREVRLEMGLRQADVADALGWPGGQSYVSYREKDPSEPGAIPPRVEELTAFEDAFELQRGTVLRRAGYVVDPVDPLEQIASWAWLAAPLRAALVRIVEPEWKNRRPPRPRERRARGVHRG